MGAALQLWQDLEVQEPREAPPRLRLVASNDSASPDPERSGKVTSRAHLRLVEHPTPEKTKTRLHAASGSLFTGKEEDVEVGLQYFGKRFLNPLLGRWVSADPLAVHAPGSADLNVYAYVRGLVMKNVDPLGLKDTSTLKTWEKGKGSTETTITVDDGRTNPSSAPSGDSGSYNDSEYNNGIGDPAAPPITDAYDPLNGTLDAPGDGGGAASNSGEPTGLWEDFVSVVGFLGGDGTPRLDGSGDAGGLPLGENENGTVKGKLVQAYLLAGHRRVSQALTINRRAHER